MLSKESSGDLGSFRVRGDVFDAGVEEEVDLAGEVSLQAADDLHLGVALGGLLRDVGLRSWIEPEPANNGQVGGAVSLSVSAAGEGGGRGCVIGDEAGRGETPQSIANAASDLIRSGLSPAVTSSCPATSMPIPTRSSSCGARTSTMGLIRSSRSAISSVTSRYRLPNDFNATR